MRHLSLAILSLLAITSSINAQTGLDDRLGPPQGAKPATFLRLNHSRPDFEVLRPIQPVQEQTERPTRLPEIDAEAARDTSSAAASLFRVGAGFYYLKPYFDTNPAFARSLNDMAPTQAITTTTQTNFDWGYRMAPLAWVEYVHRDSFGVRGRWWQFDGAPPEVGAANFFNPAITATQVTSAFPLGLGILSNPNGVNAGFNDTLVIQSGLRMNVYDVEFTKELRAPIGWLMFSAGARYAETKQIYDAYLQSTPAVPGASTILSTLLSSHDFRGAGGTVSFDVGFNLGESGLSLFCTSRGSLLFGVARERASLTSATINPLGAVTSQYLDTATTQDRVLPVGELELGAEYARCVGRFRWIARVGLVNQIWFGAGNAANNQTITGSGTLLTVPVTQATDNHINLGFLGLSTTIGIQY